MGETNQNSYLAHVISPHSVSVYGESVGHTSVTDEAIITLSYDVTHKLYELLKECRTEMNVYRQTTLSTTILNNVLENYGIPHLYGSKFLVPYVSIPNSDMSVSHLSKVDVLEQSSNDTVSVELKPTPFIKGIFVSPLSKICGIMSLSKTSDSRLHTDDFQKICPKVESGIDDIISLNSNTQLNSSIKNESCSDDGANLNGLENFLPSDIAKQSEVESFNKLESDYYLIIAQVILNSPENLFKIVLEDLRSNPRLGNVCSSLLNFVNNSIKNFECSGNLIDRLLQTVEVLLDNEFIDPSPFHSVKEATNALCSIILEPKMANDCDDFPYRIRASNLLMRTLNSWCVTVEEKRKIFVTLRKALMSPEKMSLKLNYSILIMFYSLGCDILDAIFWPLLNKYLNVLCSLDEIISGKRSILLTTDICHVKSALMLVAGILYRNFWNDDETLQRLHIEADILLCSYFGENLFPVRNYALTKNSPIFPSISNKSKRNDKEDVIEVEKNYRNIQLFPYGRPFPDPFSNYVSRSKIKHTVTDVFEIPLRSYKKSDIIFSFIGSNQINHLRSKGVDLRYNVQYSGSRCVRTVRTFLKYQKPTKCVKYCNISKSSSGDIFLFI